MATLPQVRVRKRSVWFSPLLFFVALSPALLGLTCERSGDTRLASLELEVQGVNRIVDFDPMVRLYDVWLPEGATSATVRAVPMDGMARVNWYALNVDGDPDAGPIGVGGGEVTIDLPPDGESILVGVFPSGGATDGYVLYINPACSVGSPCSDGNECTADFCDPGTAQCVITPVADDTACDFGGEIGTCVSGMCEMGFPCTEQGILDAIALGGGPHTFVCNGPTVVTTQSEIFIDNDVILDGEGNLTIDGNDDHGVLVVLAGAAAELVGTTVTGGYATQGAGVSNEGTLWISDCTIESNQIMAFGGAVGGGGVFNSGTMSVERSSIQGNVAWPLEGSGIHNTGTLTLLHSGVSANAGFRNVVYNTGTLTLIDSHVSDNAAVDSNAIRSTGTLTLLNSAVVNNEDLFGGIVASGTVTVTNSTVWSGQYGWYAISHGFGTLRLVSSTVPSFWPYPAITSSGDVEISNSLILGSSLPNSGPTCDLSGSVMSLGGNIESPTNECGFTDPTDLVSVTEAELNLGPLADNGGPTPTQALLPGSVAIDHIPPSMCLDQDGLPLATDQRGVARPQGIACDVGAFEVQP